MVQYHSRLCSHSLKIAAVRLRDFDEDVEKNQIETMMVMRAMKVKRKKNQLFGCIVPGTKVSVSDRLHPPDILMRFVPNHSE